MKRHLILVGLPGSGKSTVGKVVAEQLGATFRDLDRMIERREGMPVERIFAERGEPRFRELERNTMAEVLQGEPSVVAPGGGWAAQPGELDKALAAGYVIYLKTSVTTAVERTQLHDYRPLMLTDDPFTRMRELLGEREPFYTRAHSEVAAGPRELADVVHDVVDLARRQAGW